MTNYALRGLAVPIPRSFEQISNARREISCKKDHELIDFVENKMINATAAEFERPHGFNILCGQFPKGLLPPDPSAAARFLNSIFSRSDWFVELTAVGNKPELGLDIAFNFSRLSSQDKDRHANS